MAYSKNHKKKFFYNKTTKDSTFSMPPSSVTPFRYGASQPHPTDRGHVCHVLSALVLTLCIVFLPSVCATLSVSSGRGRRGSSFMTPRHEWTQINCPRMRCWTLFTRTTSPEEQKQQQQQRGSGWPRPGVLRQFLHHGRPGFSVYLIFSMAPAQYELWRWIDETHKKYACHCYPLSIACPSCSIYSFPSMLRVHRLVFVRERRLTYNRLIQLYNLWLQLYT